MCKIRMNGFTLVFILQKEAPKRKLVKERERERELITQEVLQIKKAKNCAFTKWHKQAMNYLAWSTMPSMSLSQVINCTQ